MKKAYAWLLILAILAAGCFAFGAGLAAEAQTGTMTVHLAHDRLGEDASGFHIDVYRIGTLDGGRTLDAAYAGTGVLLTNDSEEMEAALARVEAIVDSTGAQPTAGGETAADGNLILTVPAGLYFGRMTPRNGYSMTPFFVPVTAGQNGAMATDAIVNPKLRYEAYGSITLRAFKELNGRELKAREFTFSLRTAGNRVIQRVGNSANGNVVFSALNYHLDGDQLTTELTGANGAVLFSQTQRIQGRLTNYAIRYLIQEDRGENDEITYDDNVYTVEIRLTDDGQGTIAAQDNQGNTARIFRNSLANKEPHKLTIYYKYLDTGKTAFPTYTETLWEGENYDVTSPELTGYFVTIRVVSGVMPDHDLEYTVYYYALKKGQRLVNIDDLDTPLGLGDIQIHVGVCYE